MQTAIPVIKPIKTLALVDELKHIGEDLEWYPTESSMLDVIKNHMYAEDGPFHEDSYVSLLDVGSGDGRSLNYLTKGKRYAIEKSKRLIQAMDKDIFIVGTEFQEQTLIDKSVDAIFSNMPFSQYIPWATKIITEANCNMIYLIMPTRWRDNKEIKDAIRARQGEYTVLANMDFKHAERPARAHVDIVAINIAYSKRFGHRRGGPTIDPFDLWFDTTFALDINKSETSKYEFEQRAKATQADKLEQGLVEGGDIIQVLENLYQDELAHLMKNYKAVELLDSSVLEELDVNLDSLKGALKQKVEGLKDRYWNELFQNMDKITSRLTTSARKRMLDKLTQHTHVDFTVSNAHSVVLWAVKNANVYFDSQLVDLVERTTEQASVVLYKSNNRVWGNDDWRYSRTPEGLKHYALDFRFILHRVGGLCTSTWSYEKDKYKGLSPRAFEYLSDVLVVANNLGFTTTGCAGPNDYQWESNKAVDLYYRDPVTQVSEVLISVRAFLNGNLHCRMNTKFILKLNIEFGRLSGWLHSKEDAAEELQVDESEAEAAFGTNLKLCTSNFPALITNSVGSDQ